MFTIQSDNMSVRTRGIVQTKWRMHMPNRRWRQDLQSRRLPSERTRFSVDMEAHGISAKGSVYSFYSAWILFLDACRINFEFSL